MKGEIYGKGGRTFCSHSSWSRRNFSARAFWTPGCWWEMCAGASCFPGHCLQEPVSHCVNPCLNTFSHDPSLHSASVFFRYFSIFHCWSTAILTIIIIIIINWLDPGRQVDGKVRKELKKGTQMNSLEGRRKQMVDEFISLEQLYLPPSFFPSCS